MSKTYKHCAAFHKSYLLPLTSICCLLRASAASHENLLPPTSNLLPPTSTCGSDLLDFATCSKEVRYRAVGWLCPLLLLSYAGFLAGNTGLSSLTIVLIA
jgi:hypothetical protein